MRVENEVLAVLSNAKTEGNSLFLMGQLDRKMYERTNKVLEASGGKWNRKAKAHIFDGDAFSRIDQIILSGEVEIPKDEFNYFPTPSVVVDRLMDIAEIAEGMSLLEPSAGKGSIAHRCVEEGAIVECYELMESNFQYLIDQEEFNFVGNEDFLTVDHTSKKFDRVVMNPPFAKQADIKHVLHALKFLKPNGLLVAVMSAGVTFRENSLTKEFRDLVDERGGSIEKLPDGAFKESGTMVNTVIVTIPA
ncbi:MAG TPA: RsmD family RNA methyltransferase [Dehalococcoidia bacterium]|nr:RsmD family RNA methyltransferase [Dehalococcoidia bacterium]